jgi:hypothetical protein
MAPFGLSVASRVCYHSRQQGESLPPPMNPLLRLLGAAASHGLLTGQIVFSAAFVGACELPNWIHSPRQVNACLERWMTVSALFFPSGMQTAGASNQPVLVPGRRGVFR